MRLEDDSSPQQRRVFVGQNPAEAHFIRGLLEGAGISCEIRNEHLFGARGEIPVSSDFLPSVWVLESDVGTVADVLRDFEEGEQTSGPSWTCPKCGETLEAQFTDCWNCGAARPIDPDI